jgi:hypothetical protein
VHTVRETVYRKQHQFETAGFIVARTFEDDPPECVGPFGGCEWAGGPVEGSVRVRSR